MHTDMQAAVSLKKIVLLGPESSGKTTLAKDLAAALETEWVPEFARGYLENTGNGYEFSDLLKIAKGQLAAEDALAVTANRFLICDTDCYVIKVWMEHRYGACHRNVLESIATRRYDLYLLPHPDIPWQEDPQRELPELAPRMRLHREYLDIAQNSGLPFATISGNEQQRLTAAVTAMQQHFSC